MGRKSSLVPESPLVKNRWLIYILCAATVSLCLGVGIKLVLGPGREPAPPPGRGSPAVADGDGSTADPDRAGGDSEGAPDGPRGGSMPAPPPIRPAGGTQPGELAEANRLYEEGLASLKKAMNAESGTEEAHAAMRAALKSMTAAQKAYESYLEAHPDQENALESRLSKLMSNIYWCRKSMPVTEFGSHPASTSPSRPERPVPPPHESPVPTPVERPFDPAGELAKFRSTAARGFRDGHPDIVTEMGLPLSADPRMGEYREEIRRTTDLARAMEGFLAAARKGLTALDGQDVRFALRSGEAVGRLDAGEDGPKVVAGANRKDFEVSDLAADDIMSLAEDAGGLTDADQNRAAGAYLLYRGDREAGAKQLLLARCRGADVSAFDEPLARILARAPELKAFAAWIDLAPGLADPNEEVARQIEAFVNQHAASRCFAEHRAELFRALASARARDAFKKDELFGGKSRVSGRGVRLSYEFDEAAELEDFGTAGEWTVEGGALCGAKASAWLERFAMGDAELHISLLDPAPLTVTLGWSASDPRQGIRVTMESDPAGMILRVDRGRRRIAREPIEGLRGKLELLVQKRNDRLQIAVNRKVLIKASEVCTREEGPPDYVLVTAGDSPVRIDEIELKTDLDQDWAKAGGKRFAAWIEGFWVAGPFPIDPSDLPLALDQMEWPDIEPFDPDRKGDDGKPSWRFVSCDDRHRVDLNRCFRPHDRVAAYAAVRVWSPEKRSAILEIQVDDAARASLGGEVAIANAPLGSPQRAEVKLTEGDNFLLVKIAETKGAWFLRARLLTKSGERMRDIICW